MSSSEAAEALLAAAADAQCAAPARQGVGRALVALIPELLRQLETPHRDWTVARKKQAVLRVVAGAGASDPMCAERLGRLMESWRTARPDSPVALRAPATGDDVGNAPPATGDEVGDAPPAMPAADEAARAADDAQSDANGAASSRASHDSGPVELHQLLADMSAVLDTVCEAVPRLVENEQWVREQFDALRVILHPDRGPPDRHELAQARVLLRRTADEHQRLLALRRDALQMMKAMVAQCVEWLGGLARSSGRFGEQLGVYVEEIRQSDDLPKLADTLRRLLEDTRDMDGAIQASRRDFVAAGERARQLEREVDRLADELRSTSTQLMTDHLTKLLNRRGLECSFDELARRCHADGRKLTLALLDIDDFKKLNDALGHQAGDDALSHLAALMSARVRQGDLAARFGGEEFVLLLPGLDSSEAAEVVCRLQRSLTSEVFLHRSTRVFITFSAGVAEIGAGEPMASVIERADEAMYQAKRAGKNRVQIASLATEARALPAL